MTTSDYLTQLQQDREDLVDNLEAKGITGLSGDETFTELVPEVLNIPSGSGLDWSAIGYSDTPQGVVNAYNYAKNIYDNWDSTQTDLSSKYWADNQLSIFPLVDTSSATDMSSMFISCSQLTDIPLLNTSNVTSMSTMFNYCSALRTIPQFDTSNVASMGYMFDGCSNLTTVPVLDTSAVFNMDYMFNGCNNLSDDSLNNILQMCINAINYGPSTLAYLGLNGTNYPTSRIQALPNYQDFIDAGWTIGY